MNELANATTAAPAASVEAIRAKVLDGLASVRTFAEAIGKSERMVNHYMALGMPVEYIGKTPYIVVEPSIEWLRSRRRRDLKPRRVGRPRKAALAEQATA